MSKVEYLAPRCHLCGDPTPVPGGVLPNGHRLCSSCWTWHRINEYALARVIEAVTPPRRTP